MPRPRARPPRVGPPRAPPRPERNDVMSQHGPMEKTSKLERKTHLVVALHCDLQRWMPDERKRSKEVSAPRTSSCATSMCPAPRALTRLSSARLFLLDHVQQRVRHAQVLYLLPKTSNPLDCIPRGTVGKAPTHRATADVALFDFPEAIAVCARLVHLA